MYDKSAESSQRIDAIRWELRCRNDSGQQVFERLIRTDEENWGEVYLGVLLSFVDFREPESYGRANKHRREQCEWFKRLVGDAQAATLWTSSDVDLSDVNRFVTWIETTMSSAVATYQQIMGSQSLGKLLTLGSYTQSKRHRQLTEIARKFGEEEAKDADPAEG